VYPDVSIVAASSRETGESGLGYLRLPSCNILDWAPQHEVAYTYASELGELLALRCNRIFGSSLSESLQGDLPTLPESLRQLATHLGALITAALVYRGELAGPPQSTVEVAPAQAPEFTQIETHVDAIRWLEDVAGLKKENIARLVGVERQTIYDWLEGSSIRDRNRQRILAVREVLERAMRQYPEPDHLAAWLDTPRGAEAKTPRHWLEANEIGKARLLAISTAPPRDTAVPEWTLHASPNPWTVNQQRRRERFELEDPEIDAVLLTDDED
jgi:hypothetical protein